MERRRRGGGTVMFCQSRNFPRLFGPAMRVTAGAPSLYKWGNNHATSNGPCFCLILFLISSGGGTATTGPRTGNLILVPAKVQPQPAPQLLSTQSPFQTSNRIFSLSEWNFTCVHELLAVMCVLILRVCWLGMKKRQHHAARKTALRRERSVTFFQRQALCKGAALNFDIYLDASTRPLSV